MSFKMFIEQEEDKDILKLKNFLISNDGMEEEKRDIEKTLSRLPLSHKNLVQNYNWKIHPGNTLNGDDEHVGYIDDSKKEIAVAGPWIYGREFCVLHEVAHNIWKSLSSELQKKWENIFKETIRNEIKKSDAKGALAQDKEEIFCMSYANFYSKHKLLTYSNPRWMQFIKNLPS